VARVITSEQIPLVAQQTMERIGQYSVGFVRVLGNEDDAVVAGSGTLVAVGSRRAILTADHVLQQIPASGKVWLVLCREGWSTLHRFELNATVLKKITIGKASHSAGGPDIGLLMLPPPEAARVAAKQTFYNLEKRRERALADSTIDPFGWALFGMVHEKTIDAGPHGVFTRVKGFNGSVGFGAKPIERKDDAFDYLDFVALYNEHYSGPESYEGTSGGGLWQLQYRELDGKIMVSEALLSGVAYYESARKADTRTIFCHGRRSIYEHVYAAMTTPFED